MRQGRHWVRVLVAVATTLAAGLGTGFASVAAHAVASPTITVTPSTGLASGQTLHVTGSGFDANDQIVGVECLRGTSDPNDCDLENVAFVTADAGGGFTTTFVAHRTVLTATGFTDCAPSACEMLFASALDFTDQATAPLTFDPKIPLPPTTATITPSTGLDDLQTVSVTGTGFNARADIVVLECVATPLTCGPQTDATALANGHVSTDFSLHRVITNAKFKRIDCATAVGTCEVLLFDPTDPDYRASGSLAFDASVPPPPPATLKVAPATKLPFYARVSVTGQHWSPESSVVLLECASKTSQVCAAVDFQQVSITGKLTSEPMLQRVLTDPVHPAHAPVDCAASGARCVVIAAADDGTAAVAPVAFDPDAPIPPPPSATATPAGPYRNNQVIQINGRNFAPTASFSVSECALGADEEFCFETGSGPQITGSDGSLSTQFQVERRIDPGDAGSDCRSKGVQCLLEVESEGGAVVDLPLTFKGSAAAAPAHGRTSSVSLTVRKVESWYSVKSPERELNPYARSCATSS